MNKYRYYIKNSIYSRCTLHLFPINYLHIYALEGHANVARRYRMGIGTFLQSSKKISRILITDLVPTALTWFILFYWTFTRRIVGITDLFCPGGAICMQSLFPKTFKGESLSASYCNPAWCPRQRHGESSSVSHNLRINNITELILTKIINIKTGLG